MVIRYQRQQAVVLIIVLVLTTALAAITMMALEQSLFDRRMSRYDQEQQHLYLIAKKILRNIQQHGQLVQCIAMQGSPLPCQGRWQQVAYQYSTRQLEQVPGLQFDKYHAAMFWQVNLILQRGHNKFKLQNSFARPMQAGKLCANQLLTLKSQSQSTYFFK